jgi:DNA-binding Lrp family transcriptional regulator
VAPIAPDPEGLDIAVLREMYRGGTVNLAGIDPRLNATRIAQNLGVGRARVAGRLRWWKESGFLRTYDVWLNPALFGWNGAWIAIRVDHHQAKPELFRRLGLVDGVVSGLDFLGNWISVAMVAPDLASVERRLGVIRGLVGVAEVDTPVPWPILEPKRPLTPLEIRIVRALRAEPTATLSDTARRVGISTRTMTRRYSELLEDSKVWFVPVFDFTALNVPVVSLNVRIRGGTAPELVGRRIRSRFALTLDFSSAPAGADPSARDLGFYVLLPSAANLEELEQLAASIEGVEHVESYVLVRMHDFPAWFDQHLDAIAAGRGEPGSPSRGRPARPVRSPRRAR